MLHLRLALQKNPWGNLVSFQLSAIHHDSGLSVSEGISLLEGSGPTVFALWFLWNPGACLGGDAGR